MVAGTSQQLKREAAGHVAPAVRMQREMNAAARHPPHTHTYTIDKNCKTLKHISWALMVNTFNSSIQDAEVGTSLEFQDRQGCIDPVFFFFSSFLPSPALPSPPFP